MQQPLLIKVFLFDNGLKEQKCHICDLTNMWNKKKLEMIINRKVLKNNNELNNLEILCPNCFIQKNPELRNDFNLKIK